MDNPVFGSALNTAFVHGGIVVSIVHYDLHIHLLYEHGLQMYNISKNFGLLGQMHIHNTCCIP